MLVEKFVLGLLEANCYLLSKEGEALVIDPGDDPAPVLERLNADSLALTHVLCTHLHRDHIGGAMALAEATGAGILASPLDAPLLDLPIGRGGEYGLAPLTEFRFSPLQPGRMILLSQPCLILDTPGHSPGGLSFFFPRSGVIFVGDLLFRGNVGRGDFSGGDEPTLFASVRRRVFILPDETIIHPGHGEFTTVELEKAFNPFFQESGTS